MKITKPQWILIARTILVALLAISAVLGYDIGVIQPREALIAARSQPLTRGVSHFSEIEADTLKAAAPTAIGTATPAMMSDSAGVSNLIEVRAAATPIWYTTASGDTTSSGAWTATDFTATDDATVTDDLIVTGLINWTYDEENIGLPSILAIPITYTASTGGTGAVLTMVTDTVVFVHAVFVNVTTDFDCTGDDATLIIGDGSDTDGFVILADAELQKADTEQTGSPAGWQGLVAATMGVYLDGAVSSAPHIYAPAAVETVDWLVSEASGDTLTAGAATIYIVYTRIT